MTTTTGWYLSRGPRKGPRQDETTTQSSRPPSRFGACWLHRPRRAGRLLHPRTGRSAPRGSNGSTLQTPPALPRPSYLARVGFPQRVPTMSAGSGRPLVHDGHPRRYLSRGPRKGPRQDDCRRPPSRVHSPSQHRSYPKTTCLQIHAQPTYDYLSTTKRKLNTQLSPHLELGLSLGAKQPRAGILGSRRGFSQTVLRKSRMSRRRGREPSTWKEWP